MVQWYYFLNRFFPSHSAKTAVKRVCVDQVLWASYVTIYCIISIVSKLICNLHILYIEFTTYCSLWHIRYLNISIVSVVVLIQIFDHILSRRLLCSQWREFPWYSASIENKVVWYLFSVCHVLASIHIVHVYDDPTTSSSVMAQCGVIGMVCIYVTPSAWMNDICHSMCFMDYLNCEPFPISSASLHFYMIFKSIFMFWLFVIPDHPDSVIQGVFSF